MQKLKIQQSVLLSIVLRNLDLLRLRIAEIAKSHPFLATPDT